MTTSLDYSDYVTIIYASLQTVGLLSTSIYVLLKSSSSGCVDRLKEIWSYKWIYISSLSTIYDQATDIGVLIYWYSLIGNKDIKHVNITLLFILSCIFCCIARFINICAGIVLVKSWILGIILGLFDLLITTFVWGNITNGSKNIFSFRAFEDGDDELSQIADLQYIEIFCESFPQILLQSLFLIRTFGNDIIYDTTNPFNLSLIWISLFMSIISAVNKISTIHIKDSDTSKSKGDDDSENEYKYNIRCSKCPIINIGILSVKMFYISTTVSRLFVFALLWSVVGGLFIAIMFLLCFTVFVVCVKYGIYDKDDTIAGEDNSVFRISSFFVDLEAFGFAANSMHFYQSFSLSETKRFVIHNLFNLLSLLLVLYFSIDDSFDCIDNLCADSKIRNLNYNTFVFGLVITTFVAFFIQIVLYFIIPTLKKLATKWEENYQSKKNASSRQSKKKNMASELETHN